MSDLHAMLRDLRLSSQANLELLDQLLVGQAEVGLLLAELAEGIEGLRQDVRTHVHDHPRPKLRLVPSVGDEA